MSEQVLERGMGRTPNTLTELEIEEPRVNLGAPFSSEREVGGVAVLRAMEPEETPEEAQRRQFDELVDRSRGVAANRHEAYLGEQWVNYIRETLLPNLKKDSRVTVSYDSRMVSGWLEELPTITTSDRSPVLISVRLEDEETGEIHEANVTPGQIIYLTDQFTKEQAQEARAKKQANGPQELEQSAA